MNKCENCNKEYKSRSSLFGIPNDLGVFTSFCHICFRKALPEKMASIGLVYLNNETKLPQDFTELNTKQLRLLEDEIFHVLTNRMMSRLQTDSKYAQEVKKKMDEFLPDFMKKKEFDSK